MAKPANQLALPTEAPASIASAVAAAAADPGPNDDARLAWRRALEVIRLIVARAGPKEVAFALDVHGSLLSDALAERDRKGVRAEWLPVILGFATSDERATLLGCFAEPAGFEVRPLEPLSPAEYAHELESVLLERFGVAGKEAVEQLRRLARRRR